jgi:hypothetical protein
MTKNVCSLIANYEVFLQKFTLVGNYQPMIDECGRLLSKFRLLLVGAFLLLGVGQLP